MYYLRSKAAASAIKFTVKKNAQTDMSPGVSGGVVEPKSSKDTKDTKDAQAIPASVESRVIAQKKAMASMKTELMAEEKLACSIESPDDCVACGS